MKTKLRYAILLFIGQLTFAQTEKILNGKIFFENFPISNVEVINSNSKKMAISDLEGNFFIAVKLNDTLVFVTKKYELKKIRITTNDFEKGQLIIALTLKAEELSEVTITNKHSIKLSKDKNWEQQKLDEYKLEKIPKGEQPVDFNSSPIPNGPDLVRIVGMITSLFGKEEEEKPKKALPEINFIELAKSMVNQKYYLENLKLKEEEIDLFLQFCESDPKSHQVIKDNNILSMMDFLNAKNIEFKKL